MIEQLALPTSRYDWILVHLYLLLNRPSITEPFSATCEEALLFSINYKEYISAET